MDYKISKKLDRRPRKCGYGTHLRLYDKPKTGTISVSKKLLSEKKINPAFLTIITYLTLEELIVLKLEQTAKLLSSPFFGFSLKHIINSIVTDALHKYAFSFGFSNKHTAAIIGLSYRKYEDWIKKYNPDKYFKDYINKYNIEIATEMKNEVERES